MIPPPIITKGMGRPPSHPSPPSKGTCCFLSPSCCSMSPNKALPAFPIWSLILYGLAAARYFYVNSYTNPKYFRSSELFLKPRKFSPFWNKGIARTPGSGLNGL